MVHHTDMRSCIINEIGCNCTVTTHSAN
ncbi:unnamed protein product [Spodoptera littoralis]|uniref:Uncharacterized protein n=1 Tax=Spodoptera littoralis TaxID=7109 RepID=A0A9P0N2W4_SPOLI|nr:unnamed protein product [Spodoptera littoralis]CAH1639533.1 unnamed protein product [Spodoptera littoralis]